ncbi:hypothetical protein FA15DRAFT_552961, partial [Coprinopsis marcescibilis]
FPKGLARKFLPKFIGPYKIVRDFGNNTYKVDLLNRMKQTGISDLFHAAKLQIHVPNDDRLFPGRVDSQIWEYEDDEFENEYAIDKIIRHKGAKSEAWFHILWKSGDKAWLPYEKLAELRALQDYLDAL